MLAPYWYKIQFSAVYTFTGTEFIWDTQQFFCIHSRRCNTLHFIIPLTQMHIYIMELSGDKMLHNICCIRLVRCIWHFFHTKCIDSLRAQNNSTSLTLKVLNFWTFIETWSGWIFDSYWSLKPLCSGMGEVVPALPRRPYFPHPLALCCNYPVSKCPSASVVVTSTLRVNTK